MALGDPADDAMRAGLKVAVAKAGSIHALAEMLHVNPMAVSRWDRIPAERLMQVARLTGIRPEEMRPDLFADYYRRKKVIDDLLRPKP